MSGPRRQIQFPTATDRSAASRKTSPPQGQEGTH